MTRVSSLLASALVTTLILGCNTGPEDTVIPSEPAASATVRPAALSPAAQGVTVFKIRSKGTFANVSWSNENELGFLEVSRGRSQTGGKPLVLVFYSIAECVQFSCETVVEGFGPIPLEDVTGSGKRTFSLNTDTSTNPDFFHSVGSGGPVDVDWSANSFFSQSFHVVEHSTFEGTKFINNASFSAVSATAIGSVVGSSVEQEFATMGTNHDGSITIVR
jgi:hypothetical protein